MDKSKAYTRKDFLIKDLALSIGGGGGGSWMPADDGELPPPWLSPVAAILANVELVEAVRGAMVEAVKTKQFDEVARAFVAGGTAGNATIRNAIHDIGSAVVASAGYAALGGSTAYPDPEGDGHIPPTLSPIVHVGRTVHRVSELPRLKKQLAQATAYIDKAAAARAPRSTETATVRRHLETALESLPG